MARGGFASSRDGIVAALMAQQAVPPGVTQQDLPPPGVAPPPDAPFAPNFDDTFRQFELQPPPFFAPLPDFAPPLAAPSQQADPSGGIAQIYQDALAGSRFSSRDLMEEVAPQPNPNTDPGIIMDLDPLPPGVEEVPEVPEPPPIEDFTPAPPSQQQVSAPYYGYGQPGFGGIPGYGWGQGPQGPQAGYEAWGGTSAPGRGGSFGGSGGGGFGGGAGGGGSLGGVASSPGQGQNTDPGFSVDIGPVSQVAAFDDPYGAYASADPYGGYDSYGEGGYGGSAPGGGAEGPGGGAGGAGAAGGYGDDDDDDD